MLFQASLLTDANTPCSRPVTWQLWTCETQSSIQLCSVCSESKKKLKRPTIFTISSCRRHYHVMRILQMISQKVCRYRDTGNRSSLSHCVCTLTIYGRRKIKFVGSASYCCNWRCPGTSQAHRQKIKVATCQPLSRLAGDQINDCRIGHFVVRDTGSGSW